MQRRAARPFPSGATYVEALQNTSLCFRGTDLAGAEVRTDALGRPRAISGNFASVFSLTVGDGTRYAIKCFTRDVPAQATRYRAIGEYLARLSCEWVVGFEYVEQGIFVGGSWFPVLKMQWVEAVNLTRWIEQNLDDRAALLQVTRRFAEVVAELAAVGVGHGDLQHGNLLIGADGAVKLVDYDGMYVPELAGSRANENGHRNYQSPGRSADDFGPAVDRFSAWVIYLSLVALAVDPSLWTQLRDQDAEHLLLAEQDFVNPGESFRLSTLLDHPDPVLRELAARFRDVLVGHRDAPPPLEPLTVDLVPVATPPPAAALPSWMAGHAPSPVEPAPLPVSFARRSPALAVLGWVFLSVLVVGLPWGIAATDDEVVIAAAGAPLLLWVVLSRISYVRQPETGEARAAREVHRKRRKERIAASSRVAESDKRTLRLVEAAERSKAERDRKRQELQQRHNSHLSTVERGAKRRLEGIARDKQALEAARRQAEHELLKTRQREHVSSYLAKFPIRSAGIGGVGPALATKLESCGIRTAADFSGIRIELHKQSRIALFVLADGRSVRVPGIGEVKAGHVDRWRTGVVAKAVRGQPTSLKAAAKQALDGEFAQRAIALDAERNRVVAELEVAKREGHAQLRAAQALLAEEFKTANTATTRTRVENDREVAQARILSQRAEQAVVEAAARARAHRRISYRHYARFTMTGRS